MQRAHVMLLGGARPMLLSRGRRESGFHPVMGALWCGRAVCECRLPHAHLLWQPAVTIHLCCHCWRAAHTVTHGMLSVALHV